MAICLSNLPGLSSAWSNTSTRLVDAKMTTLSSELMPAQGGREGERVKLCNVGPLLADHPSLPAVG